MKQLFDYSDVGVGLRHQLPKACVLQKVVDMSPDKNISVHFVFTRPSNTSEFEARDGYIICSMIKFDTSGSCKILVSHHVPTVARRNAYACQIEPNAGHCQGAFTIQMTRSEPQDAQLTNDGNHFRVKYGKSGSFQYTPAQIVWNDIQPSSCDEDQLVQSPLGKLLSQNFGAVNFSIR